MSQNIGCFPTSVTVPARLTTVVAHLKSTLADISKLEDAIKASAATVKAAKHEIVPLAMNAGDDLIQIKKDVGHNHFREWLELHIAYSPRKATNYMLLAKRRTAIEGQIGTGAVLTINAALRLLRPKKPTDNPDPKEAAAVAESPYSVEALRKLSAEERARLIANLAITRADVPASVAADIVQHAVGQAREVAEQEQAALAKCVAGIRAAVRTQASPAHQLEDVKAAIRRLDRAQDALDVRHFTADSFIEKPPREPDQEILLARIGRGKTAAVTNTTATHPAN
jgi:hypothetical protein